jgi:isochorismate synthase
MLSLIVQFPGERPKASQYTSSSLDDCDLILRGFRGVPYGFALSRSLEAEEFWSRFGQQSATTWENKSSSNYQDEVSQILSKIQMDEVQKVVLSRPYFYETSKASPSGTFASLCKQYPHCTVFALFHEDFGSWMGATPEVLLEGTEEGYRSMSLAGTRLSGGMNWGEKEIEEQKFVTKEIHRTLKNLGGHIRRTPQTTFGAGPVEHLMTWVNTDNQQLKVLETLEALHPTPAVCGTPTDKAQSLLPTIESYPRELYTGYIAWVKDRVYANVLLRTMKWYANGIQFYAGGGITKDSVPLNEWMETEYKISALKDAVQFK